MNRLMSKKFRVLALLALAVVMSAATYGFAAANSVPAGLAGEGQGAISGYTVSNVVYALDNSDPTQFASVSFTLSANASDVYAGVAAGGTIFWSSSCSGGPINFSCSLAGSTVSVNAANELHVSAVQ